MDFFFWWFVFDDDGEGLQKCIEPSWLGVNRQQMMQERSGEEAGRLGRRKGRFLLELSITMAASEGWEPGRVNSQVDKPGTTNSDSMLLSLKVREENRPVGLSSPWSIRIQLCLVYCELWREIQILLRIAYLAQKGNLKYDLENFSFEVLR